MKKWNSIQEVKQANEELGYYWFSKGAMTFFGTKIESGIINRCYFITSEQPPHAPRGFTVRKVRDNGDIETMGEVCQFSTKTEARDALDHTTEEAISKLSLFENAQEVARIIAYHKENDLKPDYQVMEDVAKDIEDLVSKNEELHGQESKAWAELLACTGHIIDWQEVAKHFLA